MKYSLRLRRPRYWDDRIPGLRPSHLNTQSEQDALTDYRWDH